MTDILHGRIDVPLNRLLPGAAPVRSLANDEAHAELVASIAAHGLLEPLIVVQADQTGVYHVVGGNRRRAALAELAAAGTLPEDAPIGCTVLPPNADQTEIALAENTVRVAMHPAEQALAFLQLSERGATLEEVANRFGTGKRVVARRIRLAALAPPILDAYREGRIVEEMAHAFATTADQERQLRVWREIITDAGGEGDGDVDNYDFQYYGSGAIVRALHENRASSDSAFAQFVGEEAYRAAGGGVEELLFEDESVWTDIGLLERLVETKLEAEAAKVTGWKWVHITLQDEWKFRSGCGRIWPKPAEPTEEEQATLAAAAEALRGYRHIDWDTMSEQDATDKRAEIRATHEAERAVRSALHERAAWTPEHKANAGVLLFVERDGTLGRVEGLLREGDTDPDAQPEGGDQGVATGGAAAGGAPVAAAAPGAGKPARKEREKQPQAVKDSVTALRGAVLRHALAANGPMALDLLTFHLTLLMAQRADSCNVSYYADRHILKLDEHHVNEPRATGASELVSNAVESPAADLSWLDPEADRAVQFQAYLDLPQEARAKLLAVAAAHALIPTMATDHLDVFGVAARHMQIDYAAELTAIDPEVWNEDMYWGRLRKDVIIAECRPWLGAEWAARAQKMKKRDLATDAAEKMRAHPAYLPDGFVYRAPVNDDDEAPGDRP